MKFSLLPKVQCEASFNERFGMGDRQMVQVSVQGWGWLKISQKETAFKSFFFQNTQWDLLLPVGQETKVSVTNLFGSTGQSFTIDPFNKTLKSEALLAKIQLKTSTQIVVLSANAHKHHLNILQNLDKLQSQNYPTLNVSISNIGSPHSFPQLRIKPIPETPIFEVPKPIALSQPSLDKRVVEPQHKNSLIDMQNIFKVLHKEIHNDLN